MCGPPVLTKGSCGNLNFLGFTVLTTVFVITRSNTPHAPCITDDGPMVHGRPETVFLGYRRFNNRVITTLPHYYIIAVLITGLLPYNREAPNAITLPRGVS